MYNVNLTIRGLEGLNLGPQGLDTLCPWDDIAGRLDRKHWRTNREMVKHNVFCWIFEVEVVEFLR